METKIVFKTNIDKYRHKFPDNATIIPRIGEKVKVAEGYKTKDMPFDALTVIDVTYDITKEKQIVLVELHLSRLQQMLNEEYKLNVFN